MLNWRERRKANKGKSKLLARIEIYAMIGKDGKPLFLDITSMRRWAERHAENIVVPIDHSYIERLFERGAVTEDHIKSVLKVADPKPLLVCRDINVEGDEIVDGNHTYVALAIAWEQYRKEGLVPRDAAPRASALELLPEHWKQFVLQSPNPIEN